MKPFEGTGGGRMLLALGGPSLLLLPLLALYNSFEGLPHFFLHTLIGWDVALIILLTATVYGRHATKRDGFLPLVLALYALTPDIIYIAGPPHDDWMDVFLFHIALDEILPFALAVLAVVWVSLVLGYVRFRAERRFGAP